MYKQPLFLAFENDGGLSDNKPMLQGFASVALTKLMNSCGMDGVTL